MIVVSKKKFLERIDTLPEIVRNVAFSPEIGELLSAIGRDHHLDDQRTGTIITLTGAVLLGFLHQSDLAKEIQDDTGLDMKVAQSVADEINRKIFSRIETALKEVYNPITSSEEAEMENAAREEAPIPQATIVPSRSTFKFRPPEIPGEKSAAAKGEGPLILHEEKPAETQKGFRGFSMPLSFFRSKVAAPEASSSGATAKVEMPPIITPAKRDAPRTVHYSENRTPLSPFGQREEFINLETFEKFAHPSTPIGVNRPTVPAPVSIKPAAAEIAPSTAPTIKAVPVEIKPAPVAAAPEKIPEVASPKIIAPEGGEPRLKGNTVDLR